MNISKLLKFVFGIKDDSPVIETLTKIENKTEKIIDSVNEEKEVEKVKNTEIEKPKRGRKPNSTKNMSPRKK